MKIKMKYIVAQACLVAGAIHSSDFVQRLSGQRAAGSGHSARVFPDCRPPGSIYHFKIQLYVLNT